MVTKKMRIDLKASAEDEVNLRKAAAKLGTTKVSQVIMRSVEMTANSKPDLVGCNRNAIRETDINISKGLALLQKLLAELTAVLPGISVTVDEIASWFGRGRSDMMVASELAITEFLTDKVFDLQIKRYPGLKFTRENIELPDLSALMEAASQLISISEINMHETGVLWNCYQITGGTVSIIPASVEQFKSQFRFYAQSLEEKRRLAKVRELCQSLDNFITGETIEPALLKITDVLYYDSEAAHYVPAESFVKFNLIRRS